MANFNAAPTYPVGSEPLFIASGDFNGDAYPDLVVSNDFPDIDLSILINDGTGNYSSASRIKIPSMIPFGFLVVGDFNNDGKQDIAATNEFVYGDVYLMYGDGHGGFSPPAAFKAGIRPRAMVVADFNADGFPDLAVSNAEYTPDNKSHVSILMGSPGGFVAARDFEVRTPPLALDAGDINGDGKVDLILGGNLSDELIGDGTGNFSLVRVDASDFGQVVKIADFNNDNKADILTLVNGTYLLFGDGTGAFPTKTELAGVGPSGVVVADFNGDGRTDFAVASAGYNRVTVMLGLGGGGFDRNDYAAGARPKGIVLSDVNKDGKLDLVILNSKSYDVSVLLGTGTGNFAASHNYLTQTPSPPPTPTGIVSADFNRDGKLDVAVTNFVTRDVVVFLGDGQGSFISGTSYSVFPDLPTSLALADVDRDGNLDILVTFRFGGNLGRLLGRVDGTFQPLIRQELQIAAATYVVAGDLNGDGKPDIAMLDGNSLMIALNVAQGLFGPSKIWQLGGEPNSIRLADLNGDGKLDVLVAVTDGIHDSQDGLWVGLGDGNGGITTSQKLDVGQAPFDVTVGDFDGDGKPDIAVACTFGPGHAGVSILTGNGNGGFALRESHDAGPRSGSNPHAIAMGDFNGDGIQDLAVTGINWNISVLLGQGTGSFAEATYYGTGADPLHLVTGDFNGDGKSDVITANHLSSDITALISSPCVNPTPTPTPTTSPTPTPTPTPSPSPSAPPVLLTQENSNRAVALDSVNLLPEPFPLNTDLNFSTDHRTRIMFFALNADLFPGENSSAVTFQAGGQSYPMAVEYVGKPPYMELLTEIVVRLPDQLASGDVLVSIRLHGMNSNEVVIKIR